MKRTFAIIVTAFLAMSASPLSAQVLTILHSFTNSDGAEPYAGVTASGNTLIGTTKFGGGAGSGVVYSVNTDGTGFSVLHSFTYADGGDITAGVILSGGTLYGAAYQGGAGIQQGDLFSLAQNGSSFTNTYNFSGEPDGDDPKAGLLLVGNTLYGTTSAGTGGSSDGTIFSIETNGASFTLLHTFTGSDGNESLGDLVIGNNVLYGTTYNGGDANKGGIFSIQTNGSNFMLLHSFSNTDGTFPAAGLVLSGGTLYGTASAGGQYGFGTVFSIDTNGANLTVLHNFDGVGTDGATPLAALFLSSNILYGTTSSGGYSSSGTVFSINSNGSNFTQLYAFGGSIGDGNDPVSPVILLGNSLYGTTVVGGDDGNGAAFALQISGLIFTFEPNGATNAGVGSGVGFGAGGESLSNPTATIQYQWRLNGVNIPGQTTEGLSFSNVQPTNGGSVTMTISDGTSAATSVPVGFSVAIPTATSGNDNFANRFSLGKAAEGVVSSSNITATREAGEPQILAGNPGGKSIWFKWQPTNTGTAIFSTQGSQFDTMMGVYTGTNVGALTRVPSAVNDDDAGGYLTSKVTFGCTAGTEYEIAVDGYRGASGVVALSWTSQTFSGSLPTFLQVPPTQTIVSNGASVTLVCQPSSGVPSWFFNGQSTGVTGTNFVINAVEDTNVGAYVAQVTTAAGVASTEPVYVQINALEDGTTDSNSVVWNKFLDSASASYSNPQVLIHKLGSGGDTRGYSVAQSFSSVGATGEPGEPSIAGQIGGSPVWYTYITPTNGAMVIDTSGSSFNTLLGVFIGPGNSFATLTNLGAAYTTNAALNGQPQVYISNVAKRQTNFIVVDGYGGASGTVHLNIHLGTQAVIDTPPQSQFVVAGSNATFTVGASGSTPLSYLWQFNGTNITGATNQSLTVFNVQDANVGLYTVVVSNRVSVASNSATLSFGTVPVILTQPSSQFVAAGTTAKLTVTANGTPPPDYQWKFNGGNTGANGSALSIPNFQAANQGSYSVIVSNAVQAVASSNALMLLNGTPLTLTASNRTKTYGQTVTFAGTEFAASDVVNINPVNSVTLTSSASAATATVAGSPYPIVPSAAVGAGLNNYTITYANGALTVNPAPLTVKANNRTKLYGQTVTFAGNEITASGLSNSDKVNTATLNSSGSGAAATVAGSPYPIVPSAAVGTGLNNYTISYANGALTVGKGTPVITWTNSAPVIYGTPLTSNELNATANTPGTFAYIPTNGAVLNAGSNTLSVIFTPTDTADYTTASNTVILVVSPAPLTVTAANANRQYGQANPLFTGTITGATNGDAITASYSCSATSNSAVGLHPIVPGTAVGIDLTNYTITYVAGNLTVSKAALTVTASPQNKTYGQTLAFGGGSALFTSSPLQNGETIGTVTLAVSGSGGGATAPVSGSPYTITPSAATGGTFLPGNYAITYAPGNLTVNRAALTVTASLQSKTYGQTMAFGGGSTLFTSSSLQNGETIGSVTLAVSGSGGAATAPVSGSPYTITPSAATGGTFAVGNYSITYATGNLTVSGAPLTVTASAQSKTYGQTISFGAGGTLFTSSGLKNGETIGTVTLTASGSGGTATAPVSGSPYTITPSAATGGTFIPGNYAITYAAGSLTVNRASLTVTASAESKTYGQTVVFGSGSALFTSSGLQNAETIGSVTLAVSGNGGAGPASVSGSPYTITPSAATSGTFFPGNYNINYATGSLTVHGAPLTITASGQSKTYGQTVTFGSGSSLFTSSGLQNGETVGTVMLAVAGSGGAATAPVSGSPYTITPSAATGGTFSAGNYSISYATGNLTVSGAPLTVTASAQIKTYGQMISFGAGGALFTSSGLKNGDTIGTVTLSVNNNGGAAAASVADSPYIITPGAATGGTFSPGNYAITYANGNLTVNGAVLTITASPQSKTYGQTVAFGSGSSLFTSAGLKNGETVGSVTLAVSGGGGAATASVTGSPYTITPSAATGGTFSSGNYAITYATGNLTINGASLTITASPQSKTYGQTLSFGGGGTLFTSSGLQNGETVGTVTLSVNNNGGTASTSVAGSPFIITPSAATGGTFTPGNYAISYVAGNLTVNGASLTITASSQSKTYGQTLSFGSGSTLFSSSGLQNGETIGTVTLAASGNGGAATAPVSGSPYTITPSAATGGTFAPGNYAITYANGILTVGEATPLITWVNPPAIVYGAALTSSQLNATANVPGGFAYNPTNNTALNRGTNMLSVIFTPTDAVDYSAVTDTVSLVVSPAALTVTAANRNRIYGQADPVFTGTITGLTNGDDITATYSSIAKIGSAPGTYAIVASLVDPDNRQTNYNVSLVDGTLTVGVATPMITWSNPAPIIYGTTLSSNQLNATANVPGGPAYNPTNDTALNTGTNMLSVIFAPADTVDYSSVTDTVSLVVSPAPLTVTASSFARQFGADNPVLTGTIAGLTNGDNITATFSTTATVTSPAGIYAILPTIEDLRS